MAEKLTERSIATLVEIDQLVKSLESTSAYHMNFEIDERSSVHMELGSFVKNFPSYDVIERPESEHTNFTYKLKCDVRGIDFFALATTENLEEIKKRQNEE